MEALKPYRAKIDALDDAIVDLLAERFSVVLDVAHIKAEQNIPVVIEDRVNEVRERCAARAAEKGMDEELTRRLYTLIIDYSCDLEEKVKAGQ